MDFFNFQIHQWYAISKRDLPWRNSRNPYFIWLSEIILQQTRVDQGLAYYLRFTEEFPTINELANASEDQVLKLWQGLGYYSRARNLLFTAKYIQQNYHGKFPDTYESILALKGIGEYTASAIASISFGLEFPVVDGNVFRLLSRFFGISEPIDSNSGKKVFNSLAKELIKGSNPGMHNQALMEFGALQCVPGKPDCMKCVLSEKCFAYGADKVGILPVKVNRTKQRDRFFNYLIFEYNNYIWIRQRTDKDIWKGLFEFPLIESSEKKEVFEILYANEWDRITNSPTSIIQSVSSWRIHILSHQRINYRFIRITLTEEFELPNKLMRVNKQDILSFAIPKLLESMVEEIVEK